MQFLNLQLKLNEGAFERSGNDVDKAVCNNKSYYYYYNY